MRRPWQLPRSPHSFAAVALVVGANEQIIDTRRPTAALAVLGVSAELLRQILRGTNSRPPRSSPRLWGRPWAGSCSCPSARSPTPSIVLLSLPIGPIVSALTARAGARLAVRLLDKPLTQSMDPANLRAA
jgi:hypothetical protein